MAKADHNLSFHILNKFQNAGKETRRKVDVHATAEELDKLDEAGYLLRESVIADDHLERLRTATDRLFDTEVERDKEGLTSDSSRAVILRYLDEKDPAFLDLAQHEPFVSLARGMMGPMVRLRGMSARITWPGGDIRFPPYHQHLRMNMLPRPRWFSDPHSLDALIYLDDLSDESGPVCVVPGSHKWLDREPPSEQPDPHPDEVAFRIPAGSAVIMHGNLWHRALSTISVKRRMLILSYTPCWMRRSPYGSPPESRLSDAMLKNASEGVKELYGVGGYS